MPPVVANVPVVGNVTFVLPVVVNVKALAPDVVKLEAKLKSPESDIVLAAFTTSIVKTLFAVRLVDVLVAICISYAVLPCFIPNDVSKLAVPLSIFTFVKA